MDVIRKIESIVGQGIALFRSQVEACPANQICFDGLCTPEDLIDGGVILDSGVTDAVDGGTVFVCDALIGNLSSFSPYDGYKVVVSEDLDFQFTIDLSLPGNQREFE